jgi:hypothetical protein
MKSNRDYPAWAYKTKKKWLQTVRKRWVQFRKSMDKTEVMVGCAYYPKEVYNELIEMKLNIEKLDKLMKEYYKNA